MVISQAGWNSIRLIFCPDLKYLQNLKLISYKLTYSFLFITVKFIDNFRFLVKCVTIYEI